MQRLNNLFQADSENIHFAVTRESVYLRQQRQTLEQGKARLKKNHNNILRETKRGGKERNKMDFVFSWCQHLILARLCVIAVGFLAVRLSCHSEIKQPLLDPSLFLLYLFLDIYLFG